MRQTKNVKYYLTIFFIATGAIFLYATIDAFANNGYSSDMLLSLAFAPISFTGFLFLFDKVIDLVFPKKLKKKREDKNEYQAFLNTINKEVETQVDFSVEDFRRLRESDRFQKALGQAYRVYKEGETAELSYDFLRKKFKKDTKEFIALNIVIDKVKKLKENS